MRKSIDLGMAHLLLMVFEDLTNGVGRRSHRPFKHSSRFEYYGRLQQADQVRPAAEKG
jgi:hypothetical protein